MNNKGITLIALVITIIVLLILAGVSISFVSGDNGIIKKSQVAKIKTEQANIVEQLQVIITEKMMELKAEMGYKNTFLYDRPMTGLLLAQPVSIGAVIHDTLATNVSLKEYRVYIDYLTEKGIIREAKIIEDSNSQNQGQGVLSGLLSAQPILIGMHVDHNTSTSCYYILNVNKLVKDAQTGKGDLESGDVYYILDGNLFYLSENKECILLKELIRIEWETEINGDRDTEMAEDMNA
ncbi:MAG: hypothetical protein HFJ45_04530 [Clostridia bacterium]|nr:hypothetical protein [Clostridia bacterium]